MVSVQHTLSSLPTQSIEGIQAWLDTLAKPFTPEEAEIIAHAWELAAPLYEGEGGLTDIPLMQQALGIASILAGMNMDHETIAAAILYAVPDYLDDWAEVLKTRFGANIGNLVDGLLRMERIQELSDTDILHEKEKRKGDQNQQIEGLRKMLLAMVEDIRVVLIKLAKRTQVMRSLAKASPEVQKLVARETQGIFAPLANRLGVWQIKWELEDLALRYLEPELYKKIARLLDERRVDREQYIADVVVQLESELSKAGIVAEVAGRPKHINSIINKMKRKQVDFSEVYDVRAVRILVNDIKDCYAALGLAHSLWQPIPKEFDDYIAHPKSNNYRSLHTSVIGPRNLALEVQIRTFEMHQHSELGVAAHWRYKEGSKSDVHFDEKIAWLRQILEWKEEIASSDELLEQFKNELFQDQVYVLTPQGKVIDLPKGATPVDFAYAVHTDLGHRTRGAKVDGSIVPLSYQLQNGQRVEILAAKQGVPSRDWLNPALGYLQSTRARSKVKHWFRYQSFDENVLQGRAQLDRELSRLGVVSFNQEKFIQRLRFQRLEELLAAIGRGDITQRQIVLAIQEEMPSKAEEPARLFATRTATDRVPSSGILVEGMGNLLTNLAKCCKPAPPDTIVGYITSRHGVTIHRQDCSFLLSLPEDRRNRLLSAQWGGSSATHTAEIEVTAYDRQGLLRDITDMLARERTNVIKVETSVAANQAKMRFLIEITNLEQLSRLLMLIQHLPNVVSAQRCND